MAESSPGADTARVGGSASILSAVTRELGQIGTPIQASEEVPLGAACGRVTANAVRSQMPLPRFDQSAVDGYGLSLDAGCTAGPVQVPVLDRISAGDYREYPARTGGALRVLTGARVPQGITAIVPEERTTLDGPLLSVSGGFTIGDNIRRAGEDVAKGAVIVPAGSLIDARQIAILGAAGISALTVRRKIRVSVLSNGNELRDPGHDLEGAQVYDSNRPMLLAALSAQPWIQPIDAGCHADDPKQLEGAFRELAAASDVIIATGGVTGSDADHVGDAIASAGGIVRKFRLPLKPGKTILAGSIGPAAVLGLAGNPLAALVGLMLFGRVLVRARAGLPAPAAGLVAEADEPIPHAPGRTEYLPARIVGDSPAGLLRLAPLQAGSARLAPLAMADGLVEMSGDMGAVRPGMTVRFHPFPQSLML